MEANRRKEDKGLVYVKPCIKVIEIKVGSFICTSDTGTASGDGVSWIDEEM